MFTFTVGLNYAGEGLNCNYFGKRTFPRRWAPEPYTDANRLASYDGGDHPLPQLRRGALPQGPDHDDLGLSRQVHQRRRVRRRGSVLHYVWQDQGVWYAVKDDNPYYRIRFSNRARALAADRHHGAPTPKTAPPPSAARWGGCFPPCPTETALRRSLTARFSPDRAAPRFLIGVTNDISALSAGSLSHSLLAVSDFLPQRSNVSTGPLVHKRDCFEARDAPPRAGRRKRCARRDVRISRAVCRGTLRRGRDCAARTRGLPSRSERRVRVPVSDFVWYGSSEHLTGDEYNPYTITFTYTPFSEEAPCAALCR